MINNAVVHFEIYVADMTRAKAFYEAVLGTTLQHVPSPIPDVEMDMWFFPMDKDTEMSSYGSSGSLIKMEGFSPGGGGTLVYFGCEDCAVQTALAAEHGGSVFQEKSSIGEHGYCAMVRDTEGNLIGFHSMS